MASYFVETNWGLSFIVPGVVIGAMGFINFLFLAPDPQSVGCPPADHQEKRTHVTFSSSFLLFLLFYS